MRGIAPVLLVVFATLYPNLGHACTLASPLSALVTDILTPNRRVDQRPNCSFVNGGRYDTLEGGASSDIGNGRVVQMLNIDKAVLVDCTTSESLIVNGKVEGQYEACGPYTEYSLAPYLSPRGPLKLNTGSTLAEFAAYAKSVKIEVTLDAVANQADERRKDRFDAFCGCKLFYPDSAGAQN